MVGHHRQRQGENAGIPGVLLALRVTGGDEGPVGGAVIGHCVVHQRVRLILHHFPRVFPVLVRQIIPHQPRCGAADVGVQSGLIRCAPLRFIRADAPAAGVAVASVIARDGCNQLDRAFNCLFLAVAHALLVVHVHTENRCRNKRQRGIALDCGAQSIKLAGFRSEFLIKPAEQIAFDIIVGRLGIFQRQRVREGAGREIFPLNRDDRVLLPLGRSLVHRDRTGIRIAAGLGGHRNIR